MYIEISQGMNAMAANIAERYRCFPGTDITQTLNVFTTAKTYHEVAASYTKLKVFVSVV
ncbi:MAG: hypothetical protein ACJAUG_000330 [Halioglobus sp.]|jgi:hypothetical protein